MGRLSSSQPEMAVRLMAARALRSSGRVISPKREKVRNVMKMKDKK
jgi:hypothetical protein